MENYQIKGKYEAFRIYDDKPIGPLKIPIVPPGVNPDDILPLIIDDINRRKEKDDRERPYSPLIIPDEEDPHKQH